MSGAAGTAPCVADAIGWHDAECASYAADLPLWRELARDCAGTVCDLGCGTGRVALDLGRRGHRVLAVDRDRDLLSALEARSPGLPVGSLLADVCDLEPAEPVTLAIAAMQLVQLLGGAAQRGRFLTRLRDCLEPGGRAALAIVEPGDLALAAPGLAPRDAEPDVAELAGRRYESAPLRVSAEDGVLVVERLRTCLAPGTAIHRERVTIGLQELDAATLEHEARAAGLRPGGRRLIPATSAHVGSTVVVLEVPDR